MKKFISMLMAAAVVVSSITISEPKKVVAVTNDEWSSNAIVAPAEGKLIGAGYIDIKWNNNLDNVASYTVNVDGKTLKTINASTAEVMSAEMYTTSVSAHKAYITAKLKDGTSVKTPTRTFYVTKKGLGVNNKDMGVALDPANLNLGWYYDWGTQSFKEMNEKNKAFDDLEFVPMIYGEGGLKTETFNRIKNNGYKYLLGFNEPDLQWESNIRSNIAVSRWKNYFVPNKGNLRLGSPAISTASNVLDSTWWSEYWKGLSVSDKSNTTFIAIHKYYENYSNKSSREFLMMIDETYSKYKKPIWITEFALWLKNDANQKERAKAEEFLKTVCKGLNERSYVERYAWFVPNLHGTEGSSSALYDYSTGTLTNIGKIYAQIGNPSGYKAKTYGVSSASSVNTSVAGCAKAMPTSLFDLSGKKKAFNYSIKAVKRAAGYEVQYGTKKNMKGAKTKKTTKVTSKIKISFTKKQKKQIKKKKLKKIKYYVRVRAYKTILGKKVYYSWSSVSAVKVKTK
ncbi:MAG: glycoside hydrolase family protein [Eubacterium sp.]|nr:glycoside hydrolase family protein [Eubacterium sp.]